MAISQRETVIITADSDGLFPAEFLYPADDLFPEDSGFREIKNIVAGTLTLDEILAEAPLQLGQLYSSKFECQIYLEEDLSGKYIAVYQQNNGIYSDTFTGLIDSCKLDNTGTDRKIVAYDLAYTLGQKNVADWWENYWLNRETSTLKAVRDSLLNYVGLYAEDVILPNDDLIVKKDVSLTSCSFTVMLKMICELNCCFPHIDRNGYMTYIILDTEEEPTDISDNIEGLNCEFEDFVTSEIVGVQFYDSDGQLKYTVGETENAYPISKNIFLYTALEDTLISIGNTILDYLGGFSYTPSKVKLIVGNFDLKLGDRVTVDNKSFYILENYYSGSQFIEQTISAKGEQTQYGGTKTLDYGSIVLNEKIARVGYDLDQFYTEFGEYKTTVAGEFSSQDSRINQNKSAIEAEVKARELSVNTSFANYTGANNDTAAKVATATGSSSWNTDALKKQHAGETYYDTATKHYWMWKVTLNSETGAVTSATWVDNGTVSNKYSLVTKTSDAKLDLTSTEFSVNLSNTATNLEGEFDEAQATSFANYVGTNNDTAAKVATAVGSAAWNTDTLKKQHSGEVYYDMVTKHYWMYTVTLNNETGAVSSAVWTDKGILSSKYDLVTSTANSKLNLTTTEFLVELSETSSELHQDIDEITEAQAVSFANYSGAGNDTATKVATATGSASWNTDALKKQHSGDVYYDKTTKHYWQFDVTLNSMTGAVSTAVWVDKGILTNQYSLVTSTANSKLDLTTTEFSVELNNEETERKQADLESTYNYTGAYVPTNSNLPASAWTTDTIKRTHVGEIFYNSSTENYYVYQKDGNSYTWSPITLTNNFDVVTKSNTSKFNLADDEINLEITRATKAEKAIFANYTGAYVPTTSNLPAQNWGSYTLAKSHEGETFYNTSTEKYYRWVIVIDEE